ncbi:MAG: shikimate dehydrogenase [Burkholderiales bacterium]
MTDSYAVIGNPISHSKSPQIHAAFAENTSQDIVYKEIFCEPLMFLKTVAEFREAGGKGLNITVPFKHEAFALATRRSERAQQAGAVNTLSFNGDEIAGDNTDGAGLLRDIMDNLRFEVRGKRVLLLGAGGASFGVCGPLLACAIHSLVIANRTVSKALELRARFAAHANVEACSYNALEGCSFDLVINATSAGLTGAMPALPGNLFAPDALAYDMVYGKTTPFMQFAQARGARVSDGLGMLVEQAAESFYIWRGVRPQTAPVMALLRGAAR